MQRIKIGTDSTADIPKYLQEELNISVLPLSIAVGSKQYLDGVDITPEEFYEIMENSDVMPTSSQVTPYLYTELYEKTWQEGYTDLVQVCLNAKGSATWQGAVQMRELFYEEHPEAKDSFNIHIIDSRTYSMGYGWAVIAGARMVKEGAELQQVLYHINDWIEHARPMFVPLELGYVKKSGRVSAAAALVGDILGIKPLITFEDGESKVVAKVRGEAKAVAALVDTCLKERKPGTPYTLVYGNNAKQFAKLKELVAEKMDQPPEFEYAVGSIISINTGPNMIAIIYRT